MFDVLSFHENVIPELKRFAKKTLDIDGAFNAAAELKYIGKLNNILDSAKSEPPDNFVKYIMSEIYGGRATPKAVDEFRPIIKRGFNQYITDAVNDRLKNAMKDSQSEIQEIPSEQNDGKAETVDKFDDSPMTLEELEAFAIVKSILRDIVDVDRLTWQQTKSYMVVLVDNNSRKRICRFWFNRAQKYITTPDEEMNPVRFDISGLNDIYKCADRLREVCSRYL